MVDWQIANKQVQNRQRSQPLSLQSAQRSFGGVFVICSNSWIFSWCCFGVTLSLPLICQRKMNLIFAIVVTIALAFNANQTTEELFKTLNLPEGFKIELWASNLTHARSIARAPTAGSPIFVGSFDFTGIGGNNMSSSVYAISVGSDNRPQSVAAVTTLQVQPRVFVEFSKSVHVFCVTLSNRSDSQWRCVRRHKSVHCVERQARRRQEHHTKSDGIVYSDYCLFSVLQRERCQS